MCNICRPLVTAILVFGLTACDHQKHKVDTKTLDFGVFTIETPHSWTKIKDRGIDSYVGRIAIDSTDTLDFDYGLYSNNLHEYDPTILDSSMMKDVDTSQINEIIFVKNRMRVDPDKYRKNNISWDTINGHKAKIVFPRQSGLGTTGIYIDSLLVSGSDVLKFNLYGENLKPENEKKVLDALRTLQFHKK
jgi:hypothetical protein